MHLIATGRVLLRTAGDMLELSAPLDLDLEDGCIQRVRPWRSESRVPRIGDPEAILMPGLIDSHIHLVAAAADRTGVDLSEKRPRTIAALLERLTREADRLPAGTWLRASGHEEAFLLEGRHPTLAELSIALPHHPLRLRHATRHASIVNGRAWALLERRLGRLSSDVAPRDEQGGPMGLLLGLEGELTELVPRVSRPELDEALARVGRELAALGVVSVDEMTATNAADRVARLANAVEQGGIPQRVRAYVCDADEIEAAHRASRSLVEVVGVKRLAHSTDEVNAPEFGAAIDRARRAGAPVAVHAIEPDVVESVLSVFESAVPRAVGLLTSVRDRIEHCSLCPPELASRLARAGVGVVTHPAFLPARGERYVRQVESPLWPWLYPLHSLRRAGVVVAAGTDAPVGPLDPWLGFRGATERRAGSGIVLGEGERLSPREALELHTEAAWQLRGENRAAAWPCAGDRADLVLLEGDPRRARLDELEVCGTVIGGLIAHGCAA